MLLLQDEVSKENNAMNYIQQPMIKYSVQNLTQVEIELLQTPARCELKTPCRWKQHEPLKPWYPTTTLHSIITQKSST